MLLDHGTWFYPSGYCITDSKKGFWSFDAESPELTREHAAVGRYFLVSSLMMSVQNYLKNLHSYKISSKFSKLLLL